MPLDLTFLGHSGFLISDGSVTVAIDPFLTGNPMATMKADAVECDHIVVTHGHADHFSDVPGIAKRTGAKVFAAFEICNYLEENGIENLEPMNPGGKVKTDFGFVALTPAFHSSSFEGRYMGQPCGAVVNIADTTLYHTGDTALFEEMKIIADLYRPEIAMICCGDRFTMGPDHARFAAEWINAPHVIPIHYKTWPLLVDDISEFSPSGITVRAMEPGERWIYRE